MSKVGYVNSIQSMGTLDGPGVRFVVFLQGCPLRCGCCHNPETRSLDGGTEYSATLLAEKALRYKNYFGKEGGITLSGGEPLLQTEFAAELFAECKKRGINTCLDTSGCLMNDDVKKLLALTDHVLLDIKYPTDEQYLEYVGCSIEGPLAFLNYLNDKGVPTTIRQVIIPTLNDSHESISYLKKLKSEHRCVDKIELLPFKKICQTKYDSMGIGFPFKDYDTPTEKQMQGLLEKL